MRTIIIGLGNPLLGDDGIGWRVAEAVSNQLSVISDQSSAISGQQSAVRCQPSAISHQPSAKSQPPIANSQQLITNNQQPTTNNQEPTTNNPIEVDCLSLGGLSLMERLVGYDRAIIIDAISTGKNPVGTVFSLRLEDMPDYSAHHMASAHDASLQTALRLGREMGAYLPGEILVVAIEAQNVYEFSEELTPAVAAALPEAVERVIKLL